MGLPKPGADRLLFLSRDVGRHPPSHSFSGFQAASPEAFLFPAFSILPSTPSGLPGDVTLDPETANRYLQAVGNMSRINTGEISCAFQPRETLLSLCPGPCGISAGRHHGPVSLDPRVVGVPLQGSEPRAQPTHAGAGTLHAPCLLPSLLSSRSQRGGWLESSSSALSWGRFQPKWASLPCKHAWSGPSLLGSAVPLSLGFLE